jgi:hypothetical protein
VKLITDAEATKANMITGIKDLLAGARPVVGYQPVMATSSLRRQASPRTGSVDGRPRLVVDDAYSIGGI